MTTCDIHKLTSTHKTMPNTHTYTHVHRMLTHMDIPPLQMRTEMHIKTYKHRHRLDVQPYTLTYAQVYTHAHTQP